MTELLSVDTGQRRLKLTASDYLLLDRNGAFAHYNKTELIDGDIYFVNAQHRPHGMVKMRLYHALQDAVATFDGQLEPVMEFSLALSDASAPEPDLMLTSEPEGDGLVPLASVALVIEVSDTTLAMDIGRKLAIYARAGVPEYWIADLNARVIDQMWAPECGSYSERQEVPFGERIVSATLAELIVETQAL